MVNDRPSPASTRSMYHRHPAEATTISQPADCSARAASAAPGGRIHGCDQGVCSGLVGAQGAKYAGYTLEGRQFARQEAVPQRAGAGRVVPLEDQVEEIAPGERPVEIGHEDGHGGGGPGVAGGSPFAGAATVATIKCVRRRGATGKRRGRAGPTKRTGDPMAAGPH
jgi:hypothetical protein